MLGKEDNQKSGRELELRVMIQNNKNKIKQIELICTVDLSAALPNARQGVIAANILQKI